MIHGRDEAVASATRNFEAAERERVASVSRALAGFVVRQAEFYAGQMKELESLTQVCCTCMCLPYSAGNTKI